MAKYQPSMKSHPWQGCPISRPGWYRGLIWCKIRLELAKGRRDAPLCFFVSIGYGNIGGKTNEFSDKMQTKTA